MIGKIARFSRSKHEYLGPVNRCVVTPKSHQSVETNALVAGRRARSVTCHAVSATLNVFILINTKEEPISRRNINVIT